MSRTFVPLWVKSNCSFLEGASHPEELVERAAAFGLPALALTDRDGVYGVVQAHQAVGRHGGRLIVGSELRVTEAAAAEAADTEAAGVGPPAGAVFSVVLLATDRDAYGRLCGLITVGRRRSPKGTSLVTVEEVCSHAAGLVALWTGRGRPGLERGLESRVLARMREALPGSLYLACARHLQPDEPSRERELAALARRFGLPGVAAPEVLYHDPSRRDLQDVLTCIRHGVTLHGAGSLLRPNASHALPSVALMRRRYADAPGLLDATVEIAERCLFSLAEIEYRYPEERVPSGRTTAEWLWELTMAGARTRYGGSIPPDVRSQLQKELGLIEELGYGGYFLTMREIVEYCRRHGILAQGRGSAANSAVCYCLGITAVDPVRMDLLFERFLSRERAEPPDIDLDIEHRRREEVIRYVYSRYGRERAAMVANVIRYRLKSAIRDVGKALDVPATTIDRLARLASSRDVEAATLFDEAGLAEPTRGHLARLVTGILDFPRHLSIHPGGFLLGSEPVHRLVPVENATMPGRTVIQWDKYDVEAMNLFKVDLLGLGALTHLDYAFRLLKRHRGVELDMARIPHDDPAVFDLASRADTVGVFQLESRAQMAMLPRLKPRCWYDLVIEVSIVRPGPITGGMVHPYLRRRCGEEPVVYPHPALEPVLRKTLGIPIFQEQVMKLAVVAADYTPGEADQLRRDMAAWRSAGRIEQHRERLVSRMIARGIQPEFAEAVFNQIRGFGEYGFPESHAASFALIAYCTAWMRVHYPAEFVCALLNAWPMGFYSPASIVEDARRHGLEMRPIDLLASDWDCTLEPAGGTPGGAAGRSEFAVRMGLRYVRGISEADYRRIVQGRQRLRLEATGEAAALLERFVQLAGIDEDLLAALARSGALGCFGLDRRQALWGISGSAERRLRVVPAAAEELDCAEGFSPAFDGLSDFELVTWDYHSAGHSVTRHPLEPHREQLERSGHRSAAEIRSLSDGSRASHVGLVITRQRPQTAGGTLFVTLEDETGYVNLVVWKRVFEEHRRLLVSSGVLGAEGRVQAADGVVHLVVDRCFAPELQHRTPQAESRDFR